MQKRVFESVDNAIQADLFLKFIIEQQEADANKSNRRDDNETKKKNGTDVRHGNLTKMEFWRKSIFRSSMF